MRKYRVTIKYTLDVEADNACAAHTFAKRLTVGGPTCSVFRTFSSLTSKVSDFWFARRNGNESVKVSVEAA